jgi:hypothetical protein
MRIRRPSRLAIAAAVASILFGAAITAAWAQPHGDAGPAHTSGPETELDLRATPKHVVAGGTVVLTGRLSLEATDTCDGDDAAEGSDDCTDGAGRQGPPAWAGSRETSRCDDARGGPGSGDCSDDASDTPIPGVEVGIFSSAADGAWTQVTTVTTDAEGAFSTETSVSVDTEFEARFPGNETYGPAREDAEVEVVAAVTPPAPTSSAVGGTRFSVCGKATPGAGRITVNVYKAGRRGRLVRVGFATASAKGSAYAARLVLPAGTYQISATAAGGRVVHAASSRLRALKVSRPRR